MPQSSPPAPEGHGRLNLDRRRGEKIIITTPRGQVVVTNFGVDERGQVRLGFEAPPEVKILRGEISPPALRQGR